MLVILDHKDQAWPAGPRNKNAIVSISIGEGYQRAWEAACKDTWVAYGDRYGLDIIVIQYHLDDSERARSRSVSWQKLLMLAQPWASGYERLVWVDSDIVFCKKAPNILESVPDHAKVGISESGDQLSAIERQIYIERLVKLDYGVINAELLWRYFQQNNFEGYGITSQNGIMFGAGVFVVSPALHNAMLLQVYENQDRGRLYEQPFLSHTLITQNAYQKISPRFNWGVFEFLTLQFPDFLGRRASVADVEAIMPHLLNELDKSYFLHFAGCPSVLEGYAAVVGATAAAA